MDELTYDFLPGTSIYLYQHRYMFRTNTDTALLGHFMKIRKRDIVLDIGTNNGALLLYAMQQQPRQLIGVELEEEAANLAKKNLALYNQSADIICGDILKVNLQPVSCIVCNPPYFSCDSSSNLNYNQHLKRARHESYLPLDQLISKISQLLQDRGRVYMVHRASRIIDICTMMRKENLEIKTLQFVYDKRKNEAITVLIEAMKNGKVNCKILSPHYIY